jgi:hypothetical protein
MTPLQRYKDALTEREQIYDEVDRRLVRKHMGTWDKIMRDLIIYALVEEAHETRTLNAARKHVAENLKTPGYSDYITENLSEWTIRHTYDHAKTLDATLLKRFCAANKKVRLAYLAIAKTCQ